MSSFASLCVLEIGSRQAAANCRLAACSPQIRHSYS
jgi:hypothetical protein